MFVVSGSGYQMSWRPSRARSAASSVSPRTVSAYTTSWVSLSRMWPARNTPFISATSAAAPASASSSGSLYDTAVKRWNSTNVNASGPATAGSRQQNTRSHGTKTSSNTVSVSSILWRDDSGKSNSSRSPAEYEDTYIDSPGALAGTANATA